MAHPAVKEFVRGLDRFDRSKRRTEVFADFCEMAYCALAKHASPWAEQRDRLEAQYMQVAGRYRDKDNIHKMPQLMALALSTIAAGGLDFMGQVAGEIRAVCADRAGLARLRSGRLPA